MTITNEQILQWAQDWYDTTSDSSPSSEIDYIAQRAYEYGAAQVTKLNMEPIGEVRNSSAYFYNGMYTDKTDVPDGTQLFTTTHLQQAVAQERAKLDTLVDMAIGAEKDYVAELETALRQVRDAISDFDDWPGMKAAIGTIDKVLK